MATRAPPSISEWAPVVGDWEVANGTATYRAAQLGVPQPYGIALSDARLTKGHVSTRVRFGQDIEAARVLLGYAPFPGRYVTAGLGGEGRAYVIAEYRPGQGWIPRQVAGMRSHLRQDRDYRLTVQVQGQRLQLEVDGIVVLEDLLDEPLSGTQVGLFAWGKGEATFSETIVVAEPSTAFVIMQFTAPYLELYEDVIRPVVEEMDLRCYLAKEVYGPSFIPQDIERSIQEAEVVIAEITPVNANVFYEVGYARALKKPTILLAERSVKLPFDLQSYRCIFYDDGIRGKKEVEENLRRYLQAVLRRGGPNGARPGARLASSPP